MAKHDDEDIGGKEHGAVRFRFQGDTKKAQKLAGVGRAILGDLKNRMRLGEVNALRGQKRLPDGSIIVASSNTYGLSPVDEVLIFSPPPKPAGDQDIILGFIVRITSRVKSHLSLNVLEPDADPEATGVNEAYWHDTAWTDGDDYQAYLDSGTGPEYGDLDYGFEKSFDVYDDLTIPEGAGETGYRMEKQFEAGENVRNWVFPGTRTRTINNSARYYFGWFTTLWSSITNVEIDMIEGPIWNGYEGLYVEALASIVGVSAWTGEPLLEHNRNLVARIEAYYNNTGESTVGYAPTVIAQAPDGDTSAPLTRYYNTNYEFDEDGTIIVKPIEDGEDADYHAFAVVKPGEQSYAVPPEYRQVVASDTVRDQPAAIDNPFYLYDQIDLTDLLRVPYPLVAVDTIRQFTPFYGDSDVIYFNKFGVVAPELVDTAPGPVYSTTPPETSWLETTTIYEYTFDTWVMNTDVKGGDYEITIDSFGPFFDQEIDDYTFDVDIKLYGSKYPTYKYSDEIDTVTMKSKKVCTITLNNPVDYDPNIPNPNIKVKDRPAN